MCDEKITHMLLSSSLPSLCFHSPSMLVRLFNAENTWRLPLLPFLADVGNDDVEEMDALVRETAMFRGRLWLKGSIFVHGRIRQGTER